jgi:periplasmic copper chaperone A
MHRPKTRFDQPRNPERGRTVLRTALMIGAASASVLIGLSSSAGASYRGPSSRTAPRTAPGNRIGALTVVNAFLPQPPSPAVAAIYLTVKNAGDRPDALVGVSSAAAQTSMLMTENANGTMGMLRALEIPAHSQASLVPGRDHLMLEQPRTTLQVGQHVLVTLHFRRAGTLAVSVPVVPLSRIVTSR